MSYLDFVPLVEMALSRQLHDRWYQAYEYHRRILSDGQCDRPCRMRQYAHMSRTLTRTVISGVLHSQTIALRSDCTLALLMNAQQDYLQARGVTVSRLPHIERALADLKWSQHVQGPAQAGQTLYSVN